MLRSFLRTSRWLTRKRINIIPCTVVRSQTLSKQNELVSPVFRNFSSSSDKVERSEVLDQAVFEEICNETLESLCDYFEELIEQAPNLKGADVTFSDGVLTVALGSSYGTYVINRQTPNKQIWLSSPVSGPKRYDLVLKNGGYWIYKHDGVSLHKLLQDEISKIVQNEVDFKSCTHSVV
ncbi:frataxin homolog, mitochondrial [Amyelois transitella]|uniref:frataxin homolog, mitochondrial n=1 Tax=Amyelois transitella TaxID=680683 RepID=UPI00298F50E1|nr:frataxin homolog, mitochondrial [Amyelois transitella]